MTTGPETIRRFLAGQQEAETRFLAELVKVPSDNPPGDCAAHAEAAATLLDGLGLTVERHPVPEDLVRANGMLTATNLVVRRRFGEGPVVALNAHGDVVPPGEGWTKDPYGAEIEDGWMYGRGVAVSKSDFATYSFALLALDAAAAAGARLAGTVELHLTYDEEAGGEIGPRWLIESGISMPDLAIGAGFSYAVVTAHNGCLHLEVEVRGRSAHAAMPATGVDALEAANGILSALYAWRKGLGAQVSQIAGIGSPQLTVGLAAGGINTNVVPDRVTFRLDRRMIPEESPEAVETELRALIEEAAGASARGPATSSARRLTPRACRFIPMPGTTPQPAFPASSTALAHAPSKRPTPIGQTSACHWPRSIKRRRSWPWRSSIFSWVNHNGCFSRAGKNGYYLGPH